MADQNDWVSGVQASIKKFRACNDLAGLIAFLEEKLLEAAVLEEGLVPDAFLASLCNELGYAYAVTQEPEKADARFSDALALNPDNENALYNRATIALSAERFTEAAAFLTRLIELSPDHAGAHYRLGLCRSMQSNPDAALPHFEKAASLDPNQPAPQYWAAECLLHRNDYARALPYFERAAELLPDNGDALRGLAICLLQTNAPAKALDVCERLLASGGASQFVALRVKGDALLALGDIVGGAQCHLDMATLDFDAREFLVERAKLLAAENPSAVRQYVETILRDIPELEPALARCRQDGDKGGAGARNG